MFFLSVGVIKRQEKLNMLILKYNLTLVDLFLLGTDQECQSFFGKGVLNCLFQYFPPKIFKEKKNGYL